MISVYLDGELPSPWKEKLEKHVAGCPECAGRIEAYRSISPVCGTGEAAVVDAAGERVWERLSASTKRGSAFPGRRALWRRRVSLPIPAVAAALVLGLTFAWTFRVPQIQEASGEMSIVSEAEFGVPEQNMESVIESLIGRSGSEVLMMRLPESQSFVSTGEPAMIRAADYSRHAAARQGRGRN